MMMNTQEQREQKDRDQEAILREKRNSMLQEQSKEPNNETNQKEFTGKNILKDPMIFQYP